MIRNAIVSLGIALLIGGCSLRAGTPLPPAPQPALTQAPSPTPVVGSALLFDGQDDYVRVEDDPSLDLETGFTIAAWIYLQGYTEWASIVTKGDKPNLNNYALHQSGAEDQVYGTEPGRLRFSACSPASVPLPESETKLALGRWYFVTVTFDGQRITFYLDGKPDGSHAHPAPLCPNDQPLYIGVDFPLASEYWHGAIDELRIWNAALTESEVRDLLKGNTSTAPGLVGYWSFDEGAGPTVQDRSGNENHGTAHGDPLWISPGAPLP